MRTISGAVRMTSDKQEMPMTKWEKCLWLQAGLYWGFAAGMGFAYLLRS